MSYLLPYLVKYVIKHYIIIFHFNSIETVLLFRFSVQLRHHIYQVHDS